MTALTCAVVVMGSAGEGTAMLGSCPAAKELVARLVVETEAARAAWDTALPATLQAAFHKVAEQLAQVSAASVAKRKPLLHSTKTKPAPAKVGSPPPPQNERLR